MSASRRPFLTSAAIVTLVATASADVPLLTTTRVANGFSSPLFLTQAPGDTDRMFVIERGGDIEIFDRQTGAKNATPFLSVPGVTAGGERGLLGLAFHPAYESNGYFYVNYTTTENTQLKTVVARYQVSGDADLADAGSAQRVLEFDQPFGNHNAGWMAFGPNDDLLYIATGDGGSGNDPFNNALDITDNWLGKILRIDVDGDDSPGDPNVNYAVPADNPFVGVTGDDEIWAYGLRNPWRNGFDRQTGDLWIADVGQGAREEVNHQPADSEGGENYGWRALEGTLETGLSPVPDSHVLPIHEYTHADGLAIVGGYPYRGQAICGLAGTYFFADNVFSTVWSLRYDGQNVSDFADRTAELIPDVGTISEPASFGQDAFGELYIVDLDGEIFRIDRRYAPGDFNGDGVVSDADYTIWADNYGAQGAAEDQGDANCDGLVSDADYTIWADNYTPQVDPAATPEPATGALLAAAGLAVLGRRRRSPSGA